MAAGSGFRYYVWDGWLLVFQIVAMQALFYLNLGLLLFGISHLDAGRVSLDLLFSAKSLDEWQIIPGFICNAVACAVLLWLLVGRAKQCLDFAITMQLTHLAACWVYAGHAPLSVSWYILNVVCIVITTVLGEFICMHADLRNIELPSKRKSSTPASPAPLSGVSSKP